MRISQKAFLAGVVVAGMGLLAAPRAMASGSSTCNASPTVEVTTDQYEAKTPCPVVALAGGNWRCAGPNEATEFTGVRYKNNKATSNLAILLTRNNEVAPNGLPTGSQVFTDCKGDPVTQLGYRSCHENAVKINGVANAGTYFWVVVTGRKVPIETTMAARLTGNGNTTKCFPITGLGLTASTNQLIQQVQRVTSQDGCVVDFITDALTGEVLSARLTEESLSKDCVSPGGVGSNGEIGSIKADEFEVTRNGQSYGNWKFGDGYIRSGVNSCTTRVIGGRVYTWGSPCPER